MQNEVESRPRSRGAVAAGRWRRRCVSIPAVFVAWMVTLCALPVVLPLVAVADALGSGPSWHRTRAVIALVWLLSCEVAGVIAAGLLWLAYAFRWRSAAFRAANAALQRAWTETLFRGSVRVFGLRLEVDGAECATETPYLLFVRHASVVDTLLAATLLANPNRIVFRYVLKRELLWDPCLDVVGCRLRNAFVSRGRGLGQRDIEAVRDLPRGLGPAEGVLIYPEGSRFTEGKRRRAVERLRDSAVPAIYERAARLRHVLPPRPGGTLALLEAAPHLDVVFLAHTGLDAVVTLRDLWRGELIGATIRVRLQRVRASDIPETREQQLEWLFDRWLDIDRWIDRWIDQRRDQRIDQQSDDVRAAPTGEAEAP